MAITDLRLQSLYGGTGFGTNRRKKPYEFGKRAPEDMTEMTKGTYENLDLYPKEPRFDEEIQLEYEEPESDPKYIAEKAALERFVRHLDEFPERGEPTFMDKLAGAGAYLGNIRRNIPGGFEAAEQAKYAGYNRDLEDWKARAEPTQELARLENARNINERQVYSTEVRDRQTARAQTERERAAREKEETDRFNAESRRIRDLAYEFRSNRWTIRTTRTDVVAVSPDGQQMVTLGSTGNLNQRDELELRNLLQMMQIQERGDEARLTARQQAEAAIKLQQEKDAAALERKKTPSAGGTGGTGTPIRQEELDKQRSGLLEYWYKTDEQARQFITRNSGTGLYEMGRRPVPNRLFPNPTDLEARQKAYDELSDRLYQLVPPTPSIRSGDPGTIRPQPQEPDVEPGAGVGLNPRAAEPQQDKPYFDFKSPGTQANPNVRAGMVRVVYIPTGVRFWVTEAELPGLLATNQFKLVEEQ